MISDEIAEAAWQEGRSSAGNMWSGGGTASTPLRSEPPIHSALFGLLVFLATEAMFFAGLISAFLILRAGSVAWPPPDQPRLPVAVTGINFLFLLLSAYTIHRALKSIRRWKQITLVSWLTAAGVLGIVFLGVQGFEWLRLVFRCRHLANTLRPGLSELTAIGPSSVVSSQLSVVRCRLRNDGDPCAAMSSPLKHRPLTTDHWRRTTDHGQRTD